MRMVGSGATIIPSIALQVGSSVLVLSVALVGIVVFMIVLLLRILPLIHKPRVVMRVSSKPLAASVLGASSILQGQIGEIPRPSGTEVPSDRIELEQAKARWEQLIQEAESNEHLTPEQRRAFVDEAWKRIGEIGRQLEAAA